MTKKLVILVLTALIISVYQLCYAEKDGTSHIANSTLTPQVALEKLVEGNKRFVELKVTHPDQTKQRLKEVTAGQHPFAVILCCSDSRVPPEIIFDQGLGDLFVIRVAGNILDDSVIGSIEYAVEHLGTPVVMILGHENCGAVTAAVNEAYEHTHIDKILESIHPAVSKAKHDHEADHDKAGILKDAIVNNVHNVTQDLQAYSKVIADQVEKGELKLVEAYYSLETGEVKILDK